MKILINFFILLISLSVKSQTLPMKAGMVYYKIEKKIESQTPLINYFLEERAESSSLHRLFDDGLSYNNNDLKGDKTSIYKYLNQRRVDAVEKHTASMSKIRRNLFYNTKNEYDLQNEYWLMQNINGYFGIISWGFMTSVADQLAFESTFWIYPPYKKNDKWTDYTITGTILGEHKKILPIIKFRILVTIENDMIVFKVKDGDYEINSQTGGSINFVKKNSLGESYKAFLNSENQQKDLADHFNLVDECVNKFSEGFISDLKKAIEYYEVDLD